MTNHLAAAQAELSVANDHWWKYYSGNPDDRGNPYQRGEAEYHDSRAAVFAAIAQAEAMTRIAEVAESFLEMHTGADDRTAHIADLTEQLVQAQSEYAWIDKENDRLKAENDELRQKVASYSALWDSVNGAA